MEHQASQENKLLMKLKTELEFQEVSNLYGNGQSEMILVKKDTIYQIINMMLIQGHMEDIMNMRQAVEK